MDANDSQRHTGLCVMTLLKFGILGHMLIQGFDRTDPLCNQSICVSEGELIAHVGRVEIIYTPRSVLRRVEAENRRRYHRAFPHFGCGDASSDDDVFLGRSQSTSNTHPDA